MKATSRGCSFTLTGMAATCAAQQANSSSKVLNRVIGNDPSQIFGQLGSNGQVWLLNPNGVLLPGLYVRVELEQARAEGGFVVPQQAVTRQTSGDTLRVVDTEGNVNVRPVKLGGSMTTAQGPQWVVLDGLKAGEQVMVDGFQKLQMMPPGTPVKAVPWQAPGAAPATPAAAAAPAEAPAPAASK